MWYPLKLNLITYSAIKMLNKLTKMTEIRCQNYAVFYYHFKDLLYFLFFFLYCARSGYIVAYTSYNHPSPDSWNSFNRYHFCIYIHVLHTFCTLFILLPYFSIMTHSPHSTCSTSPSFCRRKKVKGKA
jgi:hypothetical protein